VPGRCSSLLLIALFLGSGCSSERSTEAGSHSENTDQRRLSTSTAAADANAAAARTNLDTTPLSAADYAMYAGIMGGASALLANLNPDDRQALELAKAVAGGRHKPVAADERLLAHARALQIKDEDLADLQGVGARYRQVKAKVNAVIGADAQPPDKDDAVARENRRFLEAHRANIERLQRVLRDPLSRPRTP
jgi:hypothetical protein